MIENPVLPSGEPMFYDAADDFDRTKIMTQKGAIALGCGIAALVGLVGTVVVACFVYYVAQDVEGAGVWVESPHEVAVGESFELTVTVTNERPRRPLVLSDIDIAAEYLEGFTVSTVDPRPKSSMNVPMDGGRSYTFGARIPAGTSKTFTFTLHAAKPGRYSGDVDVWEGGRFLTGMAQTSVKASMKRGKE